MDNLDMTATEGSAGSNSPQLPTSKMTPNDPQHADVELPSEGSAELDEFSANSLADDEPDTLAFDDDADVAFGTEADPDVAAVESAMSAGRKQRLADKNNNIRRMLEERSDARQLQQDVDYLDFDD
jgi:hypothetical protein